MYPISDQQLDYIRNDIRSRGILMEDLQQSLLDHVCCIMEQTLPADGDFESFYAGVISSFYKNELYEIEAETILLLTFKNYYVMKKAMIVSGTISVAALIAGSFFKIMYWPGANILLVLGMVILSFMFLPLVVLFKTKEISAKRDKLILYMGGAIGFLYCLSMLFLPLHWPGGRVLWLGTLALTFFLFIPVYFFTGIRKPELKVNTIVATIILIAATGMQFTLTALTTNKTIRQETRSSSVSSHTQTEYR